MKIIILNKISKLSKYIILSTLFFITNISRVEAIIALSPISGVPTKSINDVKRKIANSIATIVTSSYSFESRESIINSLVSFREDTESITKVKSFISRDAGADISYEPTETDVNDFIDFIGSTFDNADMEGKWYILGEQFFVTVYGNGIESYNFYRRTGYPTTLQPNLDPNPGTFIRSMFYPANAVNTNSNITQKSDVSQPVFWDTGSAPVAN